MFENVRFNEDDGYDSLIITGDDAFIEECYKRSSLPAFIRCRMPKKPFSFDNLINDTDATFYTYVSVDEETWRPGLCIVMESDDIGWGDSGVHLSEDEVNELCGMPEVVGFIESVRREA